MDGTIATRAAERQRAHGGVRPFSGAHGESSITGASSADRSDVDARLPSEAEIREAGELFLAQVFGPGWEERLQSSRLDAVLAAPIDHAWVARRVERLKPISDGPARLIPKLIWDVSTVLSEPHWFETWMELALRCPREWLVQFCGLAVMKSPAKRRPGKRSFNRAPDDALRIDSRRVQSMLSLGVLAWMLCEYDPSDPRFPYVIRGLPYGAWQHLVAYWERHADREYLRVPGSTTLFGTHKAGGRWDRRECGYIAAWCQARIAIKYQPNGKAAAPGYAGPWRKNAISGEWERWSFLELRLRVEAPNLAPIAMGPSAPAWQKPMPPPANGELDALVTEPERSWYPDDEKSALRDGAEPPDRSGDACSGKHQLAPDAADSSATTADKTTTRNPETGGVQRAPAPSIARRPIHACEWDELNAIVDELEQAEYAKPADGDRDVSFGELQKPIQRTAAREATVHAPEPNGLEVWRTPEPSPARPVAERTSIDSIESASRAVVQWLRARHPGEPPENAKADLVAASTLAPSAVHAPPSDKFRAALQAYQVEKERREQSRAEQRKRKPPS